MSRIKVKTFWTLQHSTNRYTSFAFSHASIGSKAWNKDTSLSMLSSLVYGKLMIMVMLPTLINKYYSNWVFAWWCISCLCMMMDVTLTHDMSSSYLLNNMRVNRIHLLKVRSLILGRLRRVVGYNTNLSSCFCVVFRQWQNMKP